MAIRTKPSSNFFYAYKLCLPAEQIFSNNPPKKQSDTCKIIYNYEHEVYIAITYTIRLR